MDIFYKFLFTTSLFMASTLLTVSGQRNANQGQSPTKDIVPGRNVQHVPSSVLSYGEWFRFGVDKTGIYKISYDDLKDAGINPDQIDPRNIRLYGNGSGMLAEANSISRPDDLLENAILVIGEEDGHFDPGDYILFYGQSSVTWKYNAFYQLFDHEVNLYTDQTYYFLTASLGPGKRIITRPPSSDSTTLHVDIFEDYLFHEANTINIIKSGKQWFGEIFASVTSYDFTFNIPDLDTSELITLKTLVAARSTEQSHFKITANGQQIIDQDITAIVLGSSIYARSIMPNPTAFQPRDTTIKLTYTYDIPNISSIGWLDYIELNFLRHLNFHTGQLNFRYSHSVAPGNITEFNITTNANQIKVWDVSTPANIINLELIPSPSGFILKVATDSLKEFIAFDGSSYYTPAFIEKVPNQNLHGLSTPDLIIVAHPLFWGEASRLAEFHHENDGMSVIMVTPQQIYNEFSSGAQDISAIRDFVKMFYDQSLPENRPKYLLLFGDGSYDYKQRIPNNTNFVPTFESKESLKLAASFVTDDFFGCLELSEGSNASGTMDIGVGRLPVLTTEQAKGVVDKIIHYETKSAATTGEWRNRICFIADDQDGNIHLDQAEELGRVVDSLARSYNEEKIYLDAYTQVNTTSGQRYPDVNKAIDKNVSDGALIINYTGHGGEVGWADERVLDMPTINGWTNLDKMPVFVTATCEFSRFDDASLVSAGEMVLLNPAGGGIGLFTTTRLAYSQSNFGLNKRFYEAAFEIDSTTGEYPALGDLIRLAKTPSSLNIKNFVLLGDPAMKLVYPQNKIATLSIIDVQTGNETDTLKALSNITITGQVTDINGLKSDNFNGIVTMILFDKPVLNKTLGNDPTSHITGFYIQNKILYKIKSRVVNGDFTISFIVPKDITYQYGNGKISYYADDTTNYTDAQGYKFICIGGTNDLAVADITGPAIKLYLNNSEFKSGDITTPAPVMLALIEDESGINTIGNGIGHDIVAVLDSNYSNPIILNDYFVPDFDSYKKGSIQYPLGALDQGHHTLSLKAWDVYNNSSETPVRFIVDTSATLIISNVYNYPNPFNSGTNFSFTHNRPGQDLDVIVRIFSFNGQFINELHSRINSEFLKIDPLYWNGRDSSGNTLPSGIYVYTVLVISADGYMSQQSQKMLIIR